MEINGHITYETICAAKSGDTDATAKILRHYERYIRYFCKRTFYDENGTPYEVIDENRRKQIESEYINALILYYDTGRLPKGETLEKE